MRAPVMASSFGKVGSKGPSNFIKRERHCSSILANIMNCIGGGV